MRPATPDLTSAGPETPPHFNGRTVWVRRFDTPLRSFLHTETGSAALLVAAALAALVWVNVDSSSYERVWQATFSIRLGDAGVALDLRQWVNSGLMSFFFFVIGLEARREFALGELRERRRVVLPLIAGLGGIAVPVAIFLAINAGRESAHGWGVAMSTDTALALGLLALVGPRFSDRLRAFMVSVVVADDLVALLVIATAYTQTRHVVPLLAVLLYGVVLAMRSTGVRAGVAYFVVAVAAWIALLKAGIEPGVIGLAMGLLAYAFPTPRSNLERYGTVSGIP